MIVITFAELVKITDGKLLASAEQVEPSIDDLVIDSRAISQNPTKRTAFLALKGPNFDGHRFAQQVVNQGCKLLIVTHQISALDKDVTQLIVNDTRIALGQIAAFVKSKLAPKTVGITGSSGKTTVKEMVAAILSRLGKVLATQGNFNNDIGVPLTLLRLDNSHDFAVIEMGANHIGEIAYTTGLTKPDVAIINNIAAAHLEGFGDLVGVARAKGEIFSGLSDNGIAIYNQDTNYASQWQWRLADTSVRTFSTVKKASCYSENVQLDINGCASFTLQCAQGRCDITLTIPGEHNVANAIAAATIALEFGASFADISLGLAQMQPVKGRLNLHQLKDKNTGATIKLIDDSYNANLESAKAAVQLLSTYSGKKIFILGDMGELGSDARRYHQEVGEYAKSLQLNTLLSLGVLSQSASDVFSQANDNNEQSCHFGERAELMAQLVTLLTQQLSAGQQDIAILVKGSRSAHMEHVVTDIIAWFTQLNATKNTGAVAATSNNKNIEGIA